MTQGFFQFNNSIIDEILDFANSTFDLLFLSGSKGSGKSEMLQKAYPELCENNLIFYFFCFENCSIDDFLLNFYDSFKNFSTNQKISLKKYASDNFKEKLGHYFKTVEKKCLIIIENFEKIEKDSEIIDFISYIAPYDNVKIIIISRNQNSSIFFTKNISVKNLELTSQTKEDFKSKMTVLADTVDEELKENFYKITGGFELYLKMSAKYISTTGISIRDFIDEFERKKTLLNISFEEFLISKFISLVPATYLNVYKMLCVFSHTITVNFIESYNLGKKQQLGYFIKNYLISGFLDEIYIKDYFKQYIIKSLSIQEKAGYYKKAKEIYMLELEKSPKDRLLRLSRESIRKETERILNLIPEIKNDNKSSFTYIGNNNIWKNEKLIQKEKISEKFNKIQERKNFLTQEKEIKTAPKKSLIFDKRLKNEEEEQNKRFIISLINSARDFIKKYEYKSALLELTRAKETDEKQEFKIEILLLEAKIYEIISDFNYAKNIYKTALDEAIKTNDSRRYELEFSIAMCLKNLYKIDESKEKLIELINTETLSHSIKANSYIELGKFEQADLNIDKASEYYNKAIDISLTKSKEAVCRAYYLLGVLYDENQNTELAIKYYKKNCSTSDNIRENKFYSASLVNLALIYEENAATLKDATECLKEAIYFDTETGDLENIYFSQKELAKIYSKTNTVNAITYFKQAIDTAGKLNDNFKTALAYFEMGEFYYDKENDKKALICFINAKKALKDNPKDENIKRIDCRIKDIQIRLDKKTYNEIAEKYDN